MASFDPYGIYLTEDDDQYRFTNDGSSGLRTVYGLGGADVIYGDVGLRGIDGGAGNDTIYAGLGGVTRGGDGNDVIFGSTYRTTIQQDRLYGGPGDDHIIQRAGSSYLYGEKGDDIFDLGLFFCNLSGGDGDDVVRYTQAMEVGAKFLNLGSGDDFVDGSMSFHPYRSTGTVTTQGEGGDDTVIAGAGIDKFDGGDGEDLISYAFEFSLVDIDLASGTNGGAAALDVLQNVENVIGTGFDDRITGNTAANLLEGSAGSDNLSGLDGDDTLNGGVGADTMIGGIGDDVYYVDNLGDVIVEVADAGTDVVYSTISYSLNNALNGIVLIGASDINAIGSRGADVLIGNSGANVLNGRSGLDVMSGGAGSDTYYVDTYGDRVIEADVEGVDTVRSTVDFSLIGEFIERLKLTGSADVDGIGTGLENRISGNSGANFLDGKEGSDILTGGAGADTFAFSTALVSVFGIKNFDIIKDFSHADDTLQLRSDIFGDAGYGVLAEDAFWFGAGVSAHDTSDRIIYDTNSGRLFFDRDGSGTMFHAVLFAKLSNHPADLSADDFLLV